MERGTPMEKTIAVLGGDRRMALLARLLAEDGHPVRTWGLAAFGMEDTALEEAAQADRVVLPVPLSRGKNLNCTLRRCRCADCSRCCVRSSASTPAA